MSTAPEIGLRERSRRQRYENVKTAARDLFAERGYERVTTKEVAQRAGVGEATLFRMIGSKPELLLMVVGEHVAEVVNRIEAEDAVASRGDARSYLDRIYRAYELRARLFESDPENIGAFVLEGLTASATFREESILQGDRVITLVSKIITDGQTAGLLRSQPDPAAIALNCNGIYVHEVCRSPSRGFPPETFRARLRVRLEAQLELLEK